MHLYKILERCTHCGLYTKTLTQTGFMFVHCTLYVHEGGERRERGGEGREGGREGGRKEGERIR